jgi:hypothetical protein
MSSTVSEAADQLGAYARGAIGAFFGGLPGEIVGSCVCYNIEKPFKAGFDAVREAGHNLTHFNGGGDYQDTKAAYTMRQRALQEMGTSLLNARMHLGKEAALMHE